MRYFKIVFIFVLIKFTSEELTLDTLNEFNVKQILFRYGYPLETHHVVTEDGYILELHRIPHGVNKTNDIYKPAVLIVSGFLCSSADWVNMGTGKSLGLILADNGYDVWLCNNRGSTWSKAHVTLDSKKDSNKFWNFSFQELARFDLPASIDYILSVTNQKQLYYIGHSQGTFSYFAMLSEKPDYNSKIRLMMALATGDSNKYARFPFQLLRSFLEGYQKSSGDKNLHFEILPHIGFLPNLTRLFCVNNLSFREVCAVGYFLIEGYAPSQLNKTAIPLIFQNFPAGASIKQLRHFIQSETGGFRKYNYGKLKNLMIYGQDSPPPYNLSKVTSPVAVYYGRQDALISYKRAKYLIKRLPNVVIDKLFEDFAHFDFLWGVDVVSRLYKPLLLTMKNY